MASEHIKQAAQDATEAVEHASEAVGDAIGDAKDAVVDAKHDVENDRAQHDHVTQTVRTSLEDRAREREEGGY